ncbi:sigma 54-interacting transcriptional regulator [Desulfovibrio inopinatus]|uniref:sigma 54-interacting transcriptional regulator n=1 Tax=Desulfovibrio inopinatus TaxID=102109 RepID=UPI00041284C5|nr:sigma 54-interacting transcriptional regulator [Desulfovibrio inopinatus]
MRVKEIMQSPGRAITPEMSLRDVASFFKRRDVQGAHVIDSVGKVIGVFTSEDLVKALARGASLTDPVRLHKRDMVCAVNANAQLDDIQWDFNTYLAVSDGMRIVGGLDASLLKQFAGVVPDTNDAPEAQVLLDFPDPLFHVENDGTICWCNFAACRLVSRNFAQILNQVLSRLLLEVGFQIESAPNAPETILTARRDDVRFAVLSWPSQNSRTITLFRNIQEQMLTIRQLEEMTGLTQELNAIIDTSFDGIFITDEMGFVHRVNKAYERITGIRAAEVLGKNMADLVVDGYYNESVTMRVLATGQTETIIQKVKNGKTIMVTGSPLRDTSGHITRVVTNVRDVTELRRLQQELEKLSELKVHYQKELSTLRRKNEQSGRIIIRSQKMREIHDQSLRLARVDSTVLLLGESGVGKEVLAEVIHENSPRREKPFIKISCAAIPEQLLESELFGYVPGAFTGALRSGKPGLFEIANQGTLFLDEIGEMPIGLQAKLLRVLQEGTIMRVGGVHPIQVDVRIMAATNRNLEEMIRQRLFRSDLYYRLHVVPLVIPPLRERHEAIIDFLYHFLGKYNTKYGLNRQMEPDAFDYLADQEWPGNVRELENAMERIVVMSKLQIVTKAEVLRILRRTDANRHQTSHDEPLTLKTIVDQVERDAIMKALEKHRTTRKAASILGVNQSTIVRKAKRLGIILSDTE